MLVAYIDGGSRGNPGPAGFGVHIEDANGAVVHEFCESVGVATNNVAEYRGLLAALGWAAERGDRTLHIRSDSELLVRQMRGEYRVKNPGLLPLYRQACALAGRFDRIIFEHVPRSRNREADRLANLAMDGADTRGGAGDPDEAGSHVPRNPAEAGSHVPRKPPHAGQSGSAPGQNSLPFDDRLPDNSPPSPDSPGTTRTRRRR